MTLCARAPCEGSLRVTRAPSVCRGSYTLVREVVCVWVCEPAAVDVAWKWNESRRTAECQGERRTHALLSLLFRPRRPAQPPTMASAAAATAPAGPSTTPSDAVYGERERE